MIEEIGNGDLELGQKVAVKAFLASAVLDDTLEIIHDEDPQAFPDEMMVMRSVSGDLNDYVVQNILTRYEADTIEDLEGIMAEIPDYHADKHLTTDNASAER